jgi:hypothetical protein
MDMQQISQVFNAKNLISRKILIIYMWKSINRQIIQLLQYLI